ncbi:hypothetical protein [Lentzea californiensis]|uniref:hypothetical protein n=1 Tax=Lentzea californiensis TaxID=438851 RepID=UPI002165620C|nr:hypothetical protein [Lentzea californiensis]MCR3754402.1 hypothetical protein [Lentzea californiensis]
MSGNAVRRALVRLRHPELTGALTAGLGTGLVAAGRAALVVHDGSRAVLAHEHGQRLLREAGFLLAVGSRPAIKGALLDRLGP